MSFYEESLFQFGPWMEINSPLQLVNSYFRDHLIFLYLVYTSAGKNKSRGLAVYGTVNSLVLAEKMKWKISFYESELKQIHFGCLELTFCYFQNPPKIDPSNIKTDSVLGFVENIKNSDFLYLEVQILNPEYCFTLYN